MTKRNVLVGSIFVTLGLSVLALFGWVTDQLHLASLSVSFIPMAPLSAISFLLLSLALWLHYREEKRRYLFIIILSLTCVFAGDVFFTFIGLHIGGLENLLVDTQTMFGLVPLGKMSPITAILFLLCSLSLLLITRDGKLNRTLSGALCVVAVMITLTVLIGYLYNTPILYGYTIIPIALTTAICFLFITLALLLVNGEEHFPLNLLLGTQTHARLLRGFLPVTLFIIFFSGAFQIYLRNKLFSNEALIISLVAIIAIVLVTLVTIYLSKFISEQINLAETTSKRLISIVEATSDLVAMCNERGEFIYVNEAFTNATGISLSNAQNFTIHTIIGSAEIAALEGGIAMAKRDGIWKGESILLGQGFSRVVSNVIVYNRSGTGNKSYYSFIMRDISEQKQNQTKIEQINAQLKAKNEEVQEFVYSVSHDLSEPLRMVSSFVGLIRLKLDDKLDDDTRQYIQFAEGGAKRMNQMIKNLLEISRVGAEGTALKACNIIASLQDALANLNTQLTETRATVHYSKEPVMVSGNPLLLTRLFQNLISNAMRYKSMADPVIRINFTPEDSTIIVSVQDNGVGISPEAHHEIFMLFKRFHQQTNPEGSGIGLATCKKIVELHGGKIWVESSPAGSTFYFTVKNSK